MSDATRTELEPTNAYKTKVVLNLQGASLTYYAPESSEDIIRRLVGGHPVYLQTYDGHCVIVNPDQVPAIEVHDA
jgi:hypothetical protein